MGFARVCESAMALYAIRHGRQDRDRILQRRTYHPRPRDVRVPEEASRTGVARGLVPNPVSRTNSEKPVSTRQTRVSALRDGHHANVQVQEPEAHDISTYARQIPAGIRS